MAAPTLDRPSVAAPSGQPPKGVFGRLRATTASWLALRYTPYGLAPIVVLSVVTFSQSLDDASFNFALPQFVKRGIEIGSLIEVEATIAFVAIFANLALGYYAERFRRVPLLVAGAVLSGVSCMFTGFSRTAGRLNLVRGLDSGIGTNLSEVPHSPLVSDYYPPDVRARVFTMSGAFRATGTLLALPAAAIGLTTMSLEHFFMVVGGVLLAAGLLARLVLREPPRGGMERREVGLEEYADVEDEPLSFGESWRTVFAIRTVRRLFVADIVSGFGEVAQLYTILLLAIDYRLSPVGLALFSLPPVAVSLVTRFFVGSVIDRLLSSNVARVFSIYALFTGASAFGVMLFGFEPPIAVLEVGQCLLAFGGALIGPAVGALYSEIIPARVRTLGFQITNLATAPGLIIATPLFTQIYYHHGFGPVYFVAAPFYLAAGAVLLTAGAFFETDRANALAVTAAARRWTLAKAAGAKQILSLQGVKVAYDGVPVVFGVDIEVDEGEMVALLGTNGAGKSTVLRAICGTQEASGGAILFDGRDITRMPPHEIARRGLVQMPGGKGTFPDLSVRD
ncbi:MAG: ABC-type branched-chain amino acid transport system, ATPase component, partial [Frankiales bacterium]|nr:ABC-type branched-chain amino acid transport system, ATPase component [Frankiales bacterium]